MIFSGEPAATAETESIEDRSLLKHFTAEEEEFKDAISDERDLKRQGN